MKKGIRVPEELSYRNRMRYDLISRIMYSKEIKAPDTVRLHAFIIIPDFGLYNFSNN